IVVGGFLFYREQQARRVQLAQQLRVQAELRSQAVLLEAQKQRELSQTNVPVVPAGSWSPTLADGEKPDLQKIRDEAKLLMNQGHYEDALQRYLWCFHHGREYGEFDVVRLSSGLSDWVELGRRYPKAKQALVDIRDADAKEFAEGRGYSDLFQEIQSLNRELQQDDATVVLFKDILKRDKALARQCYFYVEDALVENHEYELCARYMGDPQQRFESARSGYQMEIASHRRMAEIQQRTRQQTEEMYRRTGWTNRSPLFPNTSETMIRSAESRFVGKVRLLIEILVATDQHGAAEKIQAQALETLDDDRLKSAVRDAEKRTGRQPPVIVAPAQVLPPPTVVLTPAPPSREAIARDLSARFQAAKSIMSFTERDRALSGIARDAAASGHADITKKIVGEITSFVTRDDAARAAARLLAANGHRAEALEIARSITSFTTRDATLRELVDK
ncbi:MAG TPA: hypothetical protein VK327_01565, partial [Candidatus Paceibacterota bacterium]|nr:hypothetical protein [Candidatus Paceibacterota bacterium]